MIFNTNTKSAASSASGEEKLELINTVTITSPTSSITINADGNGNAFKLKRAVVYCQRIGIAYGNQTYATLSTGSTLLTVSNATTERVDCRYTTGFVDFKKENDVWLVSNNLDRNEENTSLVYESADDIVSVALVALYDVAGTSLQNFSSGTIKLYGVRA